MLVTKERICRIAATRPLPFSGDLPLPSHPKPAAVLLIFAKGPAGLEIVLTKRSEQLRIHSGQVSFPGGKPEISDTSPAMTALRESAEETGLDASLITDLGYLPPVLTSTNYLVDPVIGFCGASPKSLHTLIRFPPEEVADVWFSPIDPLVNLDNFKQVNAIIGGINRQFWQIENTHPVIWGATATILRQLALRLD